MRADSSWLKGDRLKVKGKRLKDKGARRKAHGARQKGIESVNNRLFAFLAPHHPTFSPSHLLSLLPYKHPSFPALQILSSDLCHLSSGLCHLTSVLCDILIRKRSRDAVEQRHSLDSQGTVGFCDL
jgi:hypothetical protein